MNDYLAMAVGGILTFIVPWTDLRLGILEGWGKDAPMKMGMHVILTHTHNLYIIIYMYRCLYI